MKHSVLIDEFQRGRGSKDLAIIEGAQALKHAIRFEASILRIITCDKTYLKKFLNDVAPDVMDVTLQNTEDVSEAVFSRLSPQPHRTKVIALAERAVYKLENLDPSKPVIVLEDPKDLANIGAVIRVGAAADVSAVAISGLLDIWHPSIIRGAAGLHYAVPVFTIAPQHIPTLPKPMIALDPVGKPVKPQTLHPPGTLVFGTERHGLSKSLLDQADYVYRLPMKAGVSSLNLATSVAATLYRLYV